MPFGSSAQGFKTPIIRNSGPIFPNGNVELSTSQAKFGNSSLALDGSGDFLEFPFSTRFYVPDNWTVEMFVRLLVTTGDQGLLSFFEVVAGGVSGLNVRYTNNVSPRGIRTVVRNVASSAVSQADWTPTTNVWYHVAVVKNGTSLVTYIDGSSVQTTTINFNTGNPPSVPLLVGFAQTVNNSSLNGFLDEVRYSNIARYTGNFTPPTEPFVNDENTLILLHGDGPNNSLVFTDDNT
jgi:hypothetical protein